MAEQEIENLYQDIADGWEKQFQRLQKKQKIYEELAEKVRTASIIDREIYGDVPDSDWILIDRDDYAEMMMILSKLDLWNPWHRTFQTRITK